MGHNNIFLGPYAGNSFPEEVSYMFELNMGDDMTLRKQMTPEEYEWLYAFLESCDNNLGKNGTHRHFQGVL